MTDNEILREIQQLKAEIATFNERMADQRFADLRNTFFKKMRRTLIRESREAFTERFGALAERSVCNIRTECMEALRSILDESLNAFDGDDYQTSLYLLNRAEKVLGDNCQTCGDERCSRQVSQSLSRVRTLVTVYAKLADELDDTREHDRTSENGVEELSPDRLELMLSPLSNALRLKIMMMLEKGDRTLSEISQGLSMRTGHLMFHMRALKDYGYISSDPRSRFYSLTKRGRTALSCLGDMDRRMSDA